MKEARNLLDSDYEGMTVTQLKQEAKRQGHKGTYKLRRILSTSGTGASTMPATKRAKKGCCYFEMR